MHTHHVSWIKQREGGKWQIHTTSPVGFVVLVVLLAMILDLPPALAAAIIIRATTSSSNMDDCRAILPPAPRCVDLSCVIIIVCGLSCAVFCG